MRAVWVCWVLGLCPLTHAMTQPIEPLGCCVAYAIDAVGSPCCHVFTENATQTACLAPSSPHDFHHGACAVARGLYPGIPSMSPSTTPSSSLSPSISPEPSPLPCQELGFCEPHGVCKNATCQCFKGFGRRDVNHPDDCREYIQDMCVDSCYGRGVCDPLTRQCQCYDGFKNSNCSLWTRCQQLGFCSGHGKCSQAPDPIQCDCDEGFGGENCSEIIQDGCQSHCSGKGVCKQVGPANTLTCECSPGYHGRACDVWVGVRCPHACSGFGSCNAHGNCTCYPDVGVRGSACAIALDMCGGCRHGLCRNGSCECLSGFTGKYCDHYNRSLDHQCHALGFCSGKGVCVHEVSLSSSNTPSTATCTCFEGFGGVECSRVDEDAAAFCPGYCNGRGRCKMAETPHCECEEGWTGAGCDISHCPAPSAGTHCSGNGLCERDVLGDGFVCNCDVGWVGDGCEVSLCPNACSGNGRCLTNGTCICSANFGEEDCRKDLSHYIKTSGDIFSGSTTQKDAGNMVRGGASAGGNGGASLDGNDGGEGGIGSGEQQGSTRGSAKAIGGSNKATGGGSGVDSGYAVGDTANNQNSDTGAGSKSGGGMDITGNQTGGDGDPNIGDILGDPDSSAGVAYASGEGADGSAATSGGDTATSGSSGSGGVGSQEDGTKDVGIAGEEGEGEADTGGSVEGDGGCPNECSGRGECVVQKCACFDGFSGEDCSVGTPDPTNGPADVEGEDGEGEG